MEYFFKETPIGRLLIGADDGNVISCRWCVDEDTPWDSISADSPEGSDFIREIDRQLEDYFKGKLKSFSIPVKPEGSKFEKDVWNELIKIGYGENVTYGEIARRIGRPRAARAVGSACKKNPIGIFIPCHRVTAAGGKLGGFNGGIERKIKLLQLETKKI